MHPTVPQAFRLCATTAYLAAAPLGFCRPASESSLQAAATRSFSSDYSRVQSGLKALFGFRLKPVLRPCCDIQTPQCVGVRGTENGCQRDRECVASVSLIIVSIFVLFIIVQIIVLIIVQH